MSHSVAQEEHINVKGVADNAFAEAKARVNIAEKKAPALGSAIALSLIHI